MSRPKTTDDRWKASTCNHVCKNKHGEWVGTVETPLGFVQVWSFTIADSRGEPDRYVTTFEFIHDGMLNRRRIERRFSHRGFAIVAGRFAREIVGRVELIEPDTILSGPVQIQPAPPPPPPESDPGQIVSS